MCVFELDPYFVFELDPYFVFELDPYFVTIFCAEDLQLSRLECWTT